MRSALVLCGGYSTRMGRDKAWLPVEGEPMLARVSRLVATVAPDVVWVARPGQVLPDPSPVVVRDPQEGLGPLAAVAAGLHVVKGDAAFVTSCDAPLIRPALVERLFDRLGAHDACVPIAGGFQMTLCAVYRRAAAGEADRLVAEGKRRLRDWLEALDVARVDAGELADVDPDLESFLGANTPGQYAEVIGRLAARR